MAKNFKEIYEASVQEEQKRGRFYLRNLPDPNKTSWSTWTYEAMKTEFARSVELFTANGYDARQCAYMAEKSISLPYSGRFEFTENLMAEIIDILYCIENSIPYPLGYFDEFLSKKIKHYREAPLQGYKASTSERKHFNADINNVIRSRDKIIDLDREEPERVFTQIFRLKNEQRINFRSISDKTDTDGKFEEQMKNVLSDRAFEMMTEYERMPFISTEDYERFVLEPFGLEMTAEVKRIIELYEGRVFAWKVQRDSPFEGFRIDLSESIWTDGSNAYLHAMLGHQSQDWDWFIDLDGKVYGHAMGSIYPKTETIEQFLEQQAELYFFDKILRERHSEIADKYFIPEIRTFLHVD